jgi:hypothetical protein
MTTRSEMNEDAHIKEVFAHLGRAIWHAQVLEQGIAHALIFCDFIPKAQGNNTGQKRLSLVGVLDGYPEKTLGQLKRALNKTGEPIGQDIELMLADSLEVRNWLAHKLVNTRLQHIISCSGRDELISELVRATELFVKTDRELEVWLTPIRLRYGYTDDVLQAAYAQYKERNTL